MTDAAVAAPLPSEERVFALDVIRGVALLGIFIMNMPGFANSFYSGMLGFHHWPAWWDAGIELLRNELLGGKFNSMFSFLFGVGFTIQFARLQERDWERGHLIYLRRLLALLAFGVLHSCLLWTGDVLHIYALLGLLLLAVRNVSDRSIVTLILLCVLGPPITSLLRIYLHIPDEHIPSAAVYQSWQASNAAAYGYGTFWDAAREHTREMTFLYTDPASLVYVFGFYLQMATTLLIGVLAGRQRWVQNAKQLMPTMVAWQWTMLSIGLISGVIHAYVELHERLFANPLWVTGDSFAYVLCRLGLVTFYVVALLRLTLRGDWQSRLRPIAVVGRMPLSNYLLQTLMATFIFYGWGLGYWTRGTPIVWFALPILLYWVVQVPLSTFWMAHFKYGPMEYLWRLLTYGYSSLQAAALHVPSAGHCAEPASTPLAETGAEPMLQPVEIPSLDSSLPLTSADAGELTSAFADASAELVLKPLELPSSELPSTVDPSGHASMAADINVEATLQAVEPPPVQLPHLESVQGRAESANESQLRTRRAPESASGNPGT